MMPPPPPNRDSQDSVFVETGDKETGLSLSRKKANEAQATGIRLRNFRRAVVNDVELRVYEGGFCQSLNFGDHYTKFSSLFHIEDV